MGCLLVHVPIRDRTHNLSVYLTGIEPVTFLSSGQYSNQMSHTGQDQIVFLKSCHLLNIQNKELGATLRKEMHYSHRGQNPQNLQ